MTNEDPAHVAMPKLYGAPAYARPRPTVEATPRPFDPDELPLEALRTEDEQELARGALDSSSGAGVDAQTAAMREARSTLPGRPFRLRAITNRLRRRPPER